MTADMPLPPDTDVVVLLRQQRHPQLFLPLLQKKQPEDIQLGKILLKRYMLPILSYSFFPLKLNLNLPILG
jgi:hypothetical protein